LLEGQDKHLLETVLSRLAESSESVRLEELITSITTVSILDIDLKLLIKCVQKGKLKIVRLIFGGNYPFTMAIVESFLAQMRECNEIKIEYGFLGTNDDDPAMLKYEYELNLRLPRSCNLYVRVPHSMRFSLKK